MCRKFRIHWWAMVCVHLCASERVRIQQQSVYSHSCIFGSGIWKRHDAFEYFFFLCFVFFFLFFSSFLSFSNLYLVLLLRPLFVGSVLFYFLLILFYDLLLLLLLLPGDAAAFVTIVKCRSIQHCRLTTVRRSFCLFSDFVRFAWTATVGAMCSSCGSELIRTPNELLSKAVAYIRRFSCLG